MYLPLHTSLCRYGQGVSTLERRRTWAALAATFIVWTNTQKPQEGTRTLSHTMTRTQSMFSSSSSEQSLEAAPHPQAMSRIMFEDLMLLQPMMNEELHQLLDRLHTVSICLSLLASPSAMYSALSSIVLALSLPL